MEIEEVVPLVMGIFLNFMIVMCLGSWHFGISTPSNKRPPKKFENSISARALIRSFTIYKVYIVG